MTLLFEVVILLFWENVAVVPRVFLRSALVIMFLMLHRYDSDRDRSELLAKERLLDRQGRALTRTTSQLPDISEIQGSGGISIRETIVTEVELKHRLEREVGSVSLIF